MTIVSPPHTFKKIQAWQKAHTLVLEIYKVTGSFPKSEMYGLTSQIRRSAVSVAANIVEGYKKRSDKEFARFIEISIGSLEETKYYLLLAKELKYLEISIYQYLLGIAEEIGRLLYRFSQWLRVNG